MTLTANYGLVLPKNYVSINETQMEYVDGGISKDVKWWGIRIGLNSTETNAFAIGSSVYNYVLATALGIPCAAAGVLIGAITTYRGALLTAYNNNSSGVYLDFNWARISSIVACPYTAPLQIALAVPIKDRG